MAAGLGSDNPALRVAALQCAAALGRTELQPLVRLTLVDTEPALVFHAARAACLLGERQQSPHILAVAGRQQASWAPQALAMALAALPDDEALALAQAQSNLAQTQPADGSARRRLLRALGWLGDLRFVPWLIERMAEPALARLAGEAFSLITGANLAALQLELLAPPAAVQGDDRRADAGNDDTDHSDGDEVPGLDDDHHLPWPDAAKVQRWWAHQGPALLAASAGRRCFMGQPLGSPAPRQVLAQGLQRQRAHAAVLLCLQQPGRPLFPVAAPAHRQHRWLAQEPA